MAIDKMISMIGSYRQWPTSYRITGSSAFLDLHDYLSEDYSFPSHIAAADLRPDTV